MIDDIMIDNGLVFRRFIFEFEWRFFDEILFFKHHPPPVPASKPGRRVGWAVRKNMSC